MKWIETGESELLRWWGGEFFDDNTVYISSWRRHPSSKVYKSFK